MLYFDEHLKVKEATNNIVEKTIMGLWKGLCVCAPLPIRPWQLLFAHVFATRGGLSRWEHTQFHAKAKNVPKLHCTAWSSYNLGCVSSVQTRILSNRCKTPNSRPLSVNRSVSVCLGEDAHPKAKTSDCLEKGSLSSSVSGESCKMISGARWHSQPLGILSLSSLRLHSGENTEKVRSVRSCCRADATANSTHFID